MKSKNRKYKWHRPYQWLKWGALKRCSTVVFLLVVADGTCAQPYDHACSIVAEVGGSAFGAKLGWSIAVSADRLVVGSPHFDAQHGRVSVQSIGPCDPSSPMVHENDPYNEGHDEPSQQRFGASLSLNGSWLMVGNCSAFGTLQFCNEEAQWVTAFTLVGDIWQAYPRITAPLGLTGGAFGKAIAAEGEWCAIGGARTGNGSNARDVVYLYRLVTGMWQLRDSLFGDGSFGGAEESFGHALALNDGVLAVGASGDDELGTDCGAVHLFGRDQGGPNRWGLVRKLLPSNGQASDRFGTAVALRDGRCAVGAPKRTVNGIAAGAAYVFDRDAGLADNWGEVAFLVPIGEVLPGMDHGASIAIGPDRVAVGAPLHDLQIQDEGSVHVYRLEGEGWFGTQRIAPHEEQVIGPVGRAGTSLAFHGDQLLIGAPFAIVSGLTPPATTPTGTVLVYTEGPVTVPEAHQGSLRLWPNPVAERLWFTGSLPLQGRAQVWDGLGRHVMDLGTLASAQGSWEVDALGPGHYILVLALDDGKRLMRAFVKQ